MSLFDDASLVYIPTGYKATKNYSGKPSTGGADMTFSRASGATRVNSRGLVEKVRTNLILQSNSFDTTWTSVSSTETGGQTGYDGSSDAWLITKSGVSGRLDQTISASGVLTYSVYAKANALNWLRIVGTSTSAYFDLSNGVVGDTDAGNIAKITSVGNGWYRCEVAMSASTTIMRIYPADGNNDTSGTSGSIYIQDAQLEYGSVATDYIETTTAAVSVGPVANVPRINFDPVLPRTGSLLLEPQRTNLVTYSEYYGTYSFFQSTLTSNNVVSPEGVQNGSTITITTQTTTQGMAGATITFDGTSNYTISGYYKKTTTSVKAQLKLRYAFASGTTYSLVDFNLNTGDITASLGENPSVVSFNSDWWYVSVTTSTPPVGTGRIIVRADNQPVSTEISFFGLQCEAGSYPTSYIPTNGTSVTRVADLSQKTGASDIIGQTEGTIYWEADFTTMVATGHEDLLNIDNGVFGNTIYIAKGATGVFLTQIYVSGVLQASFSTSVKPIGTYKMALGYANNNAAFFVNGEQVGPTDTSCSIPATSRIQLGNGELGPSTSNTKKVLLFPTRLDNATLATLTSL